MSLAKKKQVIDQLKLACESNKVSELKDAVSAISHTRTHSHMSHTLTHTCHTACKDSHFTGLKLNVMCVCVCVCVCVCEW